MLSAQIPKYAIDTTTARREPSGLSIVSEARVDSRGENFGHTYEKYSHQGWPTEN
jgi:hypothetical protein